MKCIWYYIPIPGNRGYSNGPLSSSRTLAVACIPRQAPSRMRPMVKKSNHQLGHKPPGRNRFTIKDQVLDLSLAFSTQNGS